MRHPERFNPEAARGKFHADSLHRVRTARDRHIFRPIESRYGDFSTHTGDSVEHLVFRRQNGSHRALASRQSTHQAATRGNQGGGLGNSAESGHTRRGVLADAMAEDSGRLDSPTPPQLRQRVLHGEQGGLRVMRIVEQIGSVAVKQFDQSGLKIGAERRSALFDGSAEDRLAAEELAAHTRILCALAAEQECNAQLIAAVAAPGYRGRLEQPGLHVFARAGDVDGAMAQVRAAGRSGEARIGEVHIGIRETIPEAPGNRVEGGFGSRRERQQMHGRTIVCPRLRLRRFVQYHVRVRAAESE